MLTVLAVALGGALGAPARFLTDRIAAHLWGRGLPWGTFIVNVVGTFLAVMAAVLISDPFLYRFVAVGFCGALTTYSTLSYETLMLAESGRWHVALGNVAANLCGGLAAGWLAFAVAHAV
ncbi:fluoride efflux transporter FluC [Haloglycomyces albus]|uniref:fluoride efflux transporter FluC n=1 Tax=Haloglycomyces albus TaxID=526067 RepID=UPI0004ACA9F7|nr:CrcB family protein [Haloglycomyces albus]